MTDRGPAPGATAISSLSTFEGEQPRAVEALRAAVAGGRLHHAYILVGPVEETTHRLAMATAQALVCTRSEQTPINGCGECPGCRKLQGGNHPDVITVLANEKGNILVQDVRACAARLALVATEARTKVVLIPNADRMLPPAQNALLKTLEEPPGPTCFLLTTSRYRSLLPTVRSRAQRLQLSPPSKEGAVAALEGAGVPPTLAPALASLVGADVEQALHMLSLGAEDMWHTFERARREPNSDELLEAANDWGSDASRSQVALALLEVFLRDALLARHTRRPGQEPPAPGEALRRAVDRVMHLRLMEPHHLNRTLSLEGLLMELGGLGRQSPVA